MSASTIPGNFAAASQSSLLDSAEASRTASIWFLVLGGAIAFVTFMLPISENWNRSSYASYTNVDQHELTAREGTFSRQIGLASLGLFGLAAIVWPGGKELRLGGTLGVLCIAYLAWCVASCLWADDVGVAVRRVVGLLCEVLAGLGIAKRASARQFVWLVFTCALGWVVLGIAAELSLGTFRAGQFAYRFAGIFHPNESGVLCGLLAICSLYLARGSSLRLRWLLYSAAILGLTFLVLSNSRTAIVATLVAIAVFEIVTAPVRRLVLASTAIGIVSGVAMIAMSFDTIEVSADVVTAGRSDVDVSSLTGRLPLWQVLVSEYAVDSPLIGHGYGSFWTSERVVELTKSMGWPIASTHSTYIDLLLNVGFIGALLCLLMMGVAIVRAFRFERQGPRLGYGVIGMILVIGLADGLFETTIGLTYFLSFFTCGICFLLLDYHEYLRPARVGRNGQEIEIPLALRREHSFA